MDKKTDSDYIDDALNMIWRGKSDEQVKKSLVTQGLDEIRAEYFIAQAHDATKQGIRSANRGTALMMIVGGIIAVIIGLGIGVAFIFLARELGSRRLPNFVVLISIGAITGGSGMIWRGMNMLRDISKGNDSDYLV